MAELNKDEEKIGGFSIEGYNENATPQLLTLLQSRDSVLESLNHALSLTTETIYIADYGSSEGKNSMILFNEAINTFRESSLKPIHIIHNDLPTNNWEKTFKTLLNSPNTYLNCPNTTFSAIGKSFYERILPDNFIHLAISSRSFQYLSQPLSTPDNIVLSASNDPEFKARAAEIAHQDMVNFLLLRHKELASRGRLIFQVADEKSHMGQIGALNGASESIFRKGIITEEEWKDLTLSLYGRSTEEVERALNETSHLYKAISIEKVIHRKSGLSLMNAEELKEHIVKFKSLAGTVMAGPFSKSLKTRAEDEKQEILKLYMEEIGEVQVIFDNDSYLHSVVLEKID
ncbi:unnamed protein product [Blepharisma stoltei]|uniref:Uncharacterized protein n=1 Tax=Blepharisma stoltei TaxID=1481888 RepID=A0AAU9KDV7_9CILI|nr:unnamed protein product [Blepharisma stoltei]